MTVAFALAAYVSRRKLVGNDGADLRPRLRARRYGIDMVERGGYTIIGTDPILLSWGALGHCERVMQSITQNAQTVSLLFQYGVLDASAIITWADAAIVRMESPPDALMALSTTAPDRTADILSCLNRLSLGAEFWPALRSAIPPIRDFIVAHPDRAEAIANHLFHTACSFGVSEVPDDLRFVYRIDDAFSLARDGSYGEPEAVYREFMHELEKFSTMA